MFQTIIIVNNWEMMVIHGLSNIREISILK